MSVNVGEFLTFINIRRYS